MLQTLNRTMILTTMIVLSTVTFNGALSGQEKTVTQDQEQEQSVDSDCKLPEVRDELKARVKKDQDARFKMIEAQKKSDGNNVDSELLKELVEIDEDNTAWLEKQVEEHGWLGKTLVGEAGAGNAWLLVQHADRNREFQRKCLDLMNEMPDGEVSKKNIAYLTDRVLAGEGKPQRFGTQITTVDGEFTVKEVEDPDNLNKRRAEVGLPPIEEYLEMVKRHYAPQKEEADAKETDEEKSDGSESKDGKNDK